MSDSNQVKIAVKVQPNAGRNEISGLANGVWKIKVAAPPDKGKANKELVDFLSRILGLRKDALEIVRGETSHNKILAITGISETELAARFTQKK